MHKLPVISGKELVKLLLKYGCDLVSVRGSHFKISNPANGMVTVVPVHGNKDLGKGLLADILSQLGIDTKSFLDFI